MTLDEYVLAFDEVRHHNELDRNLRELARHFYICLALDLPRATIARQKLLREVGHEGLRECGPNVPDIFEARLREDLKSYVPEEESPEQRLAGLLAVLRKTVCKFIDSSDSGFSTKDPFCRCECNAANRSYGWNGKYFIPLYQLEYVRAARTLPG